MVTTPSVARQITRTCADGDQWWYAQERGSLPAVERPLAKSGSWGRGILWRLFRTEMHIAVWSPELDDDGGNRFAGIVVPANGSKQLEVPRFG